jgi:AcrR family transcriptional regulator
LATAARANTDRDRILQSMIECCADHGYSQTTVEDVIARADVRRDSFDALFAGREDCAVAALRKISSDVLTSSPETAESGGGVGEAGLLRVKALIDLMATRPGYAYFGYVEARHGGASRMYEIYESSARVLSAMIKRARGAPAPARAVRATLGGAEAVVRAEIAVGREGHLPGLAPSLAYSVLVPALGQHEAMRQHARLSELLAEGA